MVIATLLLALTSCKAPASAGQASSQSLRPPGDTSLYQLVKLKRKNPSLPPIVVGKVTRHSDLTPLQISVVRVGRAMVLVDNLGAYRWEGTPGAHAFTARSIGYADVETEKMRLVNGDSISLNFRLPPGPPMEHKMPESKK